MIKVTVDGIEKEMTTTEALILAGTMTSEAAWSMYVGEYARAMDQASEANNVAWLAVAEAKETGSADQIGWARCAANYAGTLYTQAQQAAAQA